MGVFKRFSDIISANLNELTEGFEDPEKMLKQAVREMEETIAEVTNQTAKAMANETTLSRELERNRAQEKQWQARAEKAVEEGNDDLARKALGRKNEHEKLAAALADQLEAAQEASVSLRRQLAAMKAKLAEGKRNLATLSARQRAADFRKKMETQAAGLAPEVDQCAFAKFDRMKAKVEQAEAEAAAMAELRGLDAGGAAEDVETPDEGPDVSAELAELKRKLKK
ncbi:MAG: PspA/IM30 family protein [Planctomycetes bacterium]|nr:PspA/IM30 family protein [Planctomycetota bacterium]MCG2685278.1 PspA/IM30 family protein [Planctomycetales bacterium]